MVNIDRVYYRKLIDLKSDWERKTLVLQPDFQRNFVWDVKKQSRLIESILLGYPINPIHLAEESFRHEVIDGQQRLTSVFRFIENKFKLHGLKSLQLFNGATFSKLPEKSQMQILNYSIGIFPYAGDDKLKFEIFERLNTGSTVLTAQELRNCMFWGPYNNLIRQLSEETYAKQIIPVTQKRLKPAELMLTFFSVANNDIMEAPHKGMYKSDNRTFLNDEMTRNRNMSEVQQKQRRQQWENFAEISLQLFEFPYRRKSIAGPTRTVSTRFNETLFQVFAYIIPRYSRQDMLAKIDELRDAIDVLQLDDKYQEITQLNLYSTERVYRLIPIIRELFERTLYNRAYLPEQTTFEAAATQLS